MNILIILGFFLLSFLFRALTTKYLLTYLSISPLSLFQLFKKYILIFFIVLLPFFFLAISTALLLGNTFMESDIFENFFNTYYNEYVFLLFFYLIEAFLITVIIKDANGNKILFKTALILVCIFFLFDTFTDIIYPDIDIFSEDTNITTENNRSNLKAIQ